MKLASFLTTLLVSAGIAVSAQASQLTSAFEAACERTPEIPSLVARRAEIEAQINAAGARVLDQRAVADALRQAKLS